MPRLSLLVLSLLSVSIFSGCYESYLGEPTRPGPEPGEIGDGCEEGCADGLACIVDDRFPGGYCSTPCDEGCPSSSMCITDFGDSLCFQTCSINSDCRAGYRCWRGTCRPPCSGDRECGERATCGEDGLCSGVECTSDRECPGSTCVGNVCRALPDAGLEDASVDVSVDVMPDVPTGICDSCPDACIPPEYGEPGCILPCLATRDCADGRICSRLRIDRDGDGVRESATGACLLPRGRRPTGGSCEERSENVDCASQSCERSQCTEICAADRDCPFGMSCQEIEWTGGTHRACWYAASTGVVEEWDFGRLGEGGARSLAIPPDALSVTFEVSTEEEDPTGLYGFISIEDPSGRQLLDLFSLARGFDQPHRWIPGNTVDTFSTTLPNATTDRYPFDDGLYTVAVQVLDGRPRDISMRAILLRGPERPGELPLNIHVLPGLDFSAATAASSERLDRALNVAERILSASRISFGERRFFDIPVPELSIIDSADGADSELVQLFRSAAGDPEERALNIYLVRLLEPPGSEGGLLLGIAGGVGGPPDASPGAMSGIVIAADPSVAGDAAFFGATIAHEIGHQLGLFHTREFLPPCPDGEIRPDCSPFGGVDVLADTDGEDRRNLMFPAAMMRDELPRLTEGQTRVLLRHPLVR